MKKSLSLLLISLTLSGCFRVPMDAPYGEDITLLAPDEPVEVTRRYQKWYAIWGIFELNPMANPMDVIAREQLRKVRIYTEDSIEDAIAGFFYFLVFPTGILFPQTVVVEGNRARQTEQISESNMEMTGL